MHHYEIVCLGGKFKNWSTLEFQGKDINRVEHPISDSNECTLEQLKEENQQLKERYLLGYVNILSFLLIAYVGCFVGHILLLIVISVL